MMRTHKGYDAAAVSFLVRAGDLTSAERVLLTLKGRIPPMHMEWAAAEIAQAHGDVSGLADALRAGVPWTRVMTGVRAFLYSETLAKAAVNAGDAEGAIRVLEETSALGDRSYPIVSHSGYCWMRTQLALADVYRRVGRIDDARGIEERLLRGLEAADQDFPLLIELNRRAQSH